VTLTPVPLSSTSSVVIPVPELAAGNSILGTRSQRFPPPLNFVVDSVIRLSNVKPFSFSVSPKSSSSCASLVLKAAIPCIVVLSISLIRPVSSD
jgi:hypothetical protein